jgi:hypothetical protein
MSDLSTIRWCGAAGIFGATLLLAADWILLGTLTSGSEFQRNWQVYLSAMPSWRLTVGGLAGPIGAWFYVVGFWQLYLALKPAGRVLAFVVFAGFSMSFVWVAGAFHPSLPFVADALRAKQAASGEGGAVVQAAAERTFAYAGALYHVGLAPSVVGVALLAWTVFRKRTRYPRWFLAFNPALLYALTMLFEQVPEPLGGLLVIGAGNLVFLCFFALSTVLLWNGGRREGPAVALPEPLPRPTDPANAPGGDSTTQETATPAPRP